MLPQFPYPGIIPALRKTNPAKAIQLELWWLTQCIPMIDTYKVTKWEHTRSNVGYLEVME